MSNKTMPDLSDMKSIKMRPGDLLDCGITAEMIDEVMSQPIECDRRGEEWREKDDR